jgi:hypothetical protein
MYTACPLNLHCDGNVSGWISGNHNERFELHTVSVGIGIGSLLM